MKYTNKALLLLVFLGLYIALIGCGGISRKDDSKQDTVTSADSLMDFSTSSRAKETAYSKRQTNGFGELLNNISFAVRTDDKKEFANGLIPWASIENPENEIPKLVDANRIVVPGNKVTIVIDYPLIKEFRFDAESKNGFTRAQLLRDISSAYYKIYKEEEQTATTKTIPVEKRNTTYNRNQTNGIHGIWGHDIADLVLAEVLVYEERSGKIILSLNIES